MRLPLERRYTKGYKDGIRKFGADREGRKHAGIDLYAPPGTPIMAMADGIVSSVTTTFYKNVGALIVKHADRIIRYCETSKIIVKPGDRVRAGQVLGFIGKIDGISNSMLHLEMYSDVGNGAPLTDIDNLPYKRRGDLIDPTPTIDALIL